MSAYNGPERRNPRTFPVSADAILDAVRARAAEVAIDDAANRVRLWSQITPLDDAERRLVDRVMVVVKTQGGGDAAAADR